jgi:GNAT superfamily N-acetyltransferase
MAANAPKPDSGMVYTDPVSGVEIRPWPASRDAEAAAILADATGAGSATAAQEAIDAARAESGNRVFGGLREGQLVGAYTIHRDGMANRIGVIAVGPEHRREGFGKALLMDALRRSGRRPLVAETDGEGLPFYKACGFKLVGRRKQPDGTFRYRVGWHAPGTGSKGAAVNALLDRTGKDNSQDA